MTPPKQYTLTLDKYERDNLIWALDLIMRDRRANFFNTGDWSGQILWKLVPKFDDYGDPDYRPNLDKAATEARFKLEGK